VVDSTTTLVIKNLKTYFFTKIGVVKAVDGVTFTVNQGQVMGLVGESGCGKSVTGFSILGLVDPPGKVIEGRILFKGEDLVSLPEKQMQRFRGNRIAMILQDPMMTLNPVLRIDTQMIEAIQTHENLRRHEAWRRSRDTLGRIGIPSPEEWLKAYPHQFSGGMRQRVSIAIAMLHKPDLIIADEPTTALDVTIQGQILYEVQKLCRETSTAMIWITHDLAVIAGLANTVYVMYAGKIVESGDVDSVIDLPMHPYTRGLIDSVPSQSRRGDPLPQIPGMAPSLLNLPAGCPFQPRCPRAGSACIEMPEVTSPMHGREVRCFHPHLHGAL
jgi:peptide/nickel transport system ATP-binding protein